MNIPWNLHGIFRVIKYHNQFHLFLIIPPENSFYCPKLSQIFTICVVRGKFMGKRDLISYNLVATIPIIKLHYFNNYFLPNFGFVLFVF